MKEFINDDFLLRTDAARQLYHDHAEKQPVIDYHCHLNPAYIANDRRFDNLGQIWLEGDHYKWRAMRSNGIDERYCTGKDTTDWEKFEKWAETVPYTMRNPLYAWTHLELKRVFGVSTILKPETAREIYDRCTALLHQPEYSARGLMSMFNVETVCTTDDPADDLAYHASMKKEGFAIKVLPTWRPDKAMAVDDPKSYNEYIGRLSSMTGITIKSYTNLLEALRNRHDFFAEAGCRLSDHGIEEFYAEDYTMKQIDDIFSRVTSGITLSKDEVIRFKSAMLHDLAVMDFEKGWTQQFHYGALRNNNSRHFRTLGPDTGFDSIGDFTVARSLSKFLDRLDEKGQLAKTILYNLNPRDNALIATMAGNFQDGTVAGKIQFGSGWWFLDQETGMTDQLNALSLFGLLSRFVGMLTDSRSFISYPRHEYFRRVLCNLVGEDIENGKIPASETDFAGRMIEDICYHNAKAFFQF